MSILNYIYCGELILANSSVPLLALVMSHRTRGYSVQQNSTVSHKSGRDGGPLNPGRVSPRLTAIDHASGRINARSLIEG
jgi:hypothetical protein